MPTHDLRVRFGLGIDYEVQIPADFVAILREQAKQEDAAAYIKRTSEAFENDQEFAIQVIQDNVRAKVRNFIHHTINSGGVAGRVSPANTVIIEDPELIEVRDVENPEVEGQVEQATEAGEPSQVQGGDSSLSTPAG